MLDLIIFITICMRDKSTAEGFGCRGHRREARCRRLRCGRRRLGILLRAGCGIIGRTG